MLAREFGERLRKIRTSVGWSQERLGLALDLESGKMISVWELGYSLPKAEHIDGICKSLQCSANELFGHAGFSEILEVAGLRWRVNRPSLEESGSEDVINGLKAFHMLVADGLPCDAVLEFDPFRRMGLSRLARLLQMAFLTGAIQLTKIPHQKSLEAELHNRFPILTACHVAHLPSLHSDVLIDSVVRREIVAAFAAQECIKAIEHVSSVGITGGSPISRFVDLIPPDTPELRGKKWWALLATERHLATIGLSANSCVARMLYSQPNNTGFLMPYLNRVRRNPPYASSAPDDERQEIERAQKVRNAAAYVDMAFVTVGTQEVDYQRLESHMTMPEFQDLLGQMSPKDHGRCVGDVLLRPLDENGRRIGNQNIHEANDAFVYSIELDELRRIAQRGQVWVLAARHEKAKILAALLRAGLANCLVIDNTTAKALLQV
jgi:DNA-binding transcriptional regulator LsrR (DeoR family)/DNA-binding XRE family transcriptional regulator